MNFREWKKLRDLEIIRDWTWSQINKEAEKDEDLTRRKNFIIANAKFRRELEFAKKLIKEYNEIYSKLDDSIKNTLEYSKGNYRVRVNGKFKYLKSKVIF